MQKLSSKAGLEVRFLLYEVRDLRSCLISSMVICRLTDFGLGAFWMLVDISGTHS